MSKGSLILNPAGYVQHVHKSKQSPLFKGVTVD